MKLRLKLGFSGHFAGAPEKWFSVDDPVKLLAHTVRARLRKATREHSFARLVREMGKLVQDTLFAGEATLRFEENGMVVDSCELLKLDITETLRKHAQLSEKGMLAEGAGMPAGTHRLFIQVADDRGRCVLREPRVHAQDSVAGSGRPTSGGPNTGLQGRHRPRKPRSAQRWISAMASSITAGAMQPMGASWSL